MEYKMSPRVTPSTVSRDLGMEYTVPPAPPATKPPGILLSSHAPFRMALLESAAQNETTMKRNRAGLHYLSVKSRDARDSYRGIHPDPPVPQRAHPSLP